MARQPQHVVDISVGGQKIDGWLEYEIESSMIDAVDKFNITRPFDAACHRLCVPDSKVKIRIDGVTIIDGFIDDRSKATDREGSVMTIAGRDKVGRLVQESAPLIDYSGELTDVITRLVAPWFTSASLSNVRNRNVRLGKRTIAAGANESLVKKVKIKKSWMGESWRLEPGQARWKIANDLCSEAGYLLWSSADGTELIIGQPDYAQPTTFLVVSPSVGSSTAPTALKVEFRESVADRYSLIMALGAGNGDAANYGASTVSRRDVVRNGPGIDGTGIDFTYPKRLILSERALRNLDEATAYVQREMDRRDFHKQVVSATMPTHGQISSGTTPLLFAPDTMARVIDEEQDLPVDAPYMIFACKYKSSRDAGETTELQLVPKGTVFAQ